MGKLQGERPFLLQPWSNSLNCSLRSSQQPKLPRSPPLGCPTTVQTRLQFNTFRFLALSWNRQCFCLKPDSLEKFVYPFQAAYPFLEKKGKNLNVVCSRQGRS